VRKKFATAYKHAITELDLIVQIIKTRKEKGTMIIALERVFVNTLIALTGDAPFIPRDKPRGFSGANVYKSCLKLL